MQDKNFVLCRIAPARPWRHVTVVSHTRLVLHHSYQCRKRIFVGCADVTVFHSFIILVGAYSLLDITPAPFNIYALHLRWQTCAVTTGNSNRSTLICLHQHRLELQGPCNVRQLSKYARSDGWITLQMTATCMQMLGNHNHKLYLVGEAEKVEVVEEWYMMDK